MNYLNIPTKNWKAISLHKRQCSASSRTRSRGVLARGLSPFPVGDTLTLQGIVVLKVQSTKFIEIKSVITKNNKEIVCEGHGIVQALF